MASKRIRAETYDFLLKKKEIYMHIWEGDLDNHLIRMRRDGYYSTNLELLVFFFKFNDIKHQYLNFIRSRRSRISDQSSQNAGEVNILKHRRYY